MKTAHCLLLSEIGNGLLSPIGSSTNTLRWPSWFIVVHITGLIVIFQQQFWENPSAHCAPFCPLCFHVLQSYLAFSVGAWWPLNVQRTLSPPPPPPNFFCSTDLSIELQAPIYSLLTISGSTGSSQTGRYRSLVGVWKFAQTLVATLIGGCYRLWLQEPEMLDTSSPSWKLENVLKVTHVGKNYFIIIWNY